MAWTSRDPPANVFWPATATLIAPTSSSQALRNRDPVRHNCSEQTRILPPKLTPSSAHGTSEATLRLRPQSNTNQSSVRYHSGNASLLERFGWPRIREAFDGYLVRGTARRSFIAPARRAHSGASPAPAFSVLPSAAQSLGPRRWRRLLCFRACSALCPQS